MSGGLGPALERAQIEKLRQVRASRSQSAVAEKLAALERAARTGSDLAPPILDTAKAYATVAEASGEYRAA